MPSPPPPVASSFCFAPCRSLPHFTASPTSPFTDDPSHPVSPLPLLLVCRTAPAAWILHRSPLICTCPPTLARPEGSEAQQLLDVDEPARLEALVGGEADRERPRAVLLVRAALADLARLGLLPGQRALCERETGGASAPGGANPARDRRARRGRTKIWLNMRSSPPPWPPVPTTNGTSTGSCQSGWSVIFDWPSLGSAVSPWMTPSGVSPLSCGVRKRVSTTSSSSRPLVLRGRRGFGVEVSARAREKAVRRAQVLRGLHPLNMTRMPSQGL